MTRAAEYFPQDSSPHSAGPGHGGMAFLLVLLQGAACAQDLTAPSPVAASQPANTVLSAPAAPAAIAAPAASAVSVPNVAPALIQGKLAAPDVYWWKDLNTAQRQALAPLEKDWDGIDLPRRRKWLEIAARFPSLPADEQTRVQERMRDWARLSPLERSQARIIFQQAQQITPQSRQAKWEAYQSLTPEQRQELADKAAKRTHANNAGGANARAEKNAAHVGKPVLANQVKSNLVPDRTTAPQPVAVAPTVVQNKPGATTTLINRAAMPPAHQQSGLPKILAAPDLVDPLTLLPKRSTAAPSPERSASDAGTPVRP